MTAPAHHGEADRRLPRQRRRGRAGHRTDHLRRVFGVEDLGPGDGQGVCRARLVTDPETHQQLLGVSQALHAGDDFLPQVAALGEADRLVDAARARHFGGQRGGAEVHVVLRHALFDADGVEGAPAHRPAAQRRAAALGERRGVFRAQRGGVGVFVAGGREQTRVKIRGVPRRHHHPHAQELAQVVAVGRHARGAVQVEHVVGAGRRAHLGGGVTVARVAGRGGKQLHGGGADEPEHGVTAYGLAQGQVFGELAGQDQLRERGQVGGVALQPGALIAEVHQ